jgi:pimeloyl-ACP methyl ester carboxylesterase
MTEPFADPARLRAEWAVYQLAFGRRATEPAIMDRAVDVPTLVLYGPDDQVVGPDFVHCCEIAFTDRVGPLVVPGAGHFLQWERADVFNPLVAHFFGDRRAAFS